MAAITLTLPDAQVSRLVAAVAQQRGITPAALAAMTTPEKIAMMKADLITYWKQIVLASEGPAVQEVASTAAINARIADIAANLQVT